MEDVLIPEKREFLRGIEEYRIHEKRDPMYKVATNLISSSWGNPSEVVDGLGVLLMTWNQAFYRYGVFDFDELENCIVKNQDLINSFRGRTIDSLKYDDDVKVKELFNSFLDALKIADGKSRGKRSPVSVAKALHLLAPKFFPLWDDKIAKAYNCHYSINADDQYLKYCYISKEIFNKVKDYKLDSRSTLKLIDEYNYSKYTRKWI